MKLIPTRDYLLYVDEVAEIKEGGYIYDEFGLRQARWDVGQEHNQPKVLYYWPLTKEAKELDLPLLPDPFKTDISEEEYLKELELSGQDKTHPGYGKGLSGAAKNIWKFIFNKGYKAAQPKQFGPLEMESAMLQMSRYIMDSIKNRDLSVDTGKKADEIIKSLSTQKLGGIHSSFPKEFEIEYESELSSYYKNGVGGTNKPKITTNQEGKQQVHGKYSMG